MEDLNRTAEVKVRKLVLKKNTVRVLDGNEAKALIGGRMAQSDRECTCTCKCKTILQSTCCK